MYTFKNNILYHWGVPVMKLSLSPSVKILEIRDHKVYFEDSNSRAYNAGVFHHKIEDLLNINSGSARYLHRKWIDL